MTKLGSDLEAIRETVLNYMEGMIFADVMRMKMSLHPTCLIVGHMNGVFTMETVDQFVEAVLQAGGLAAGSDYVGNIVTIDQDGEAAMVKVTNRFSGVDYTDYLTLLKIDDHWLIMHKTYREWPKDP
jgi:hypothetical protein